MNLGITIARKGSTFRVLVTPEVAFTEQRRGFRALVKASSIEECDELQLWSSSGGRVKRYKFKRVPAPAPVTVPTTVTSPESKAPTAPAVSTPAPVPQPVAPKPAKKAAKAGKKKK